MLYVFFQLTYTIYNCETTYWFTVWRFKTNCQFKCNSNSFPRKWTFRSTRIRVNISLQFHFNELYNLFISVYQLPKPPCRIVNLVGCCEVCGKRFVIWFCHVLSPKDLSRRFPSGPVFYLLNLLSVSLLFVIILVGCWLVWLFCDFVWSCDSLDSNYVRFAVFVIVDKRTPLNSCVVYGVNCVARELRAIDTSEDTSQNKTKTLTRDKWSKVLKTSRPKQPRIYETLIRPARAILP